MPPDNTAHILTKGYQREPAPVTSSQKEDTTGTGAVLPAQRSDERPGAIGGLWPQVFHPAKMNYQEAGGQGGETVLVQISEIKINPGRREAKTEDIRELADSISEVGLLNPITVDCGHILIAGLHRLEAAKLLGWTEIECTVSGLEGLQAELAEIDENFVRAELSPMDYGDLLLRRKEIYEALHPETKVGIAQAAGMNRAVGNNVTDKMSATLKSFVDDTAEKLGVDPRTVRRDIQTAKNLTPEAKNIIRDADAKITKKDALNLSRLVPEQQSEAASQLVAGSIHSVDEYQPPPAEPEPAPPPEAPMPAAVPYSSSGRHYASFEESIADLKNHDKDCSYTPDALLAELDSFIQKFQKEFEWYSDPFCTVVFPDITPVQFDYLKKRFGTISTAIHDLLQQMKRSMKK